MEIHSDKQNRSLLKVFIDNLSFPARFDRHVNTLRCLETPKEIKTKFSEYVVDFERQVVQTLEDFISGLETTKGFPPRNPRNTQY